MVPKDFLMCVPEKNEPFLIEKNVITGFFLHSVSWTYPNQSVLEDRFSFLISNFLLRTYRMVRYNHQVVLLILTSQTIALYLLSAQKYILITLQNHDNLVVRPYFHMLEC